MWSINAYAEAMFRAVKYRPAYPDRGFAHLDAVQAWLTEFIDWCNHSHRHSALKYVTPEQRHRGADHVILAERNRLYPKAR